MVAFGETTWFHHISLHKETLRKICTIIKSKTEKEKQSKGKGNVYKRIMIRSMVNKNQKHNINEYIIWE